MKCAIAIVLAIIGMALANPAPSLSYGIASPLLYPSVSVSSSIVNHGYHVPKVVVAAPIIKTVAVAPVFKAPITYSLGWGGYGGYGLGYGLKGYGWGGYGLGYGLKGYGWGGLGYGGYGLAKGWH